MLMNCQRSTDRMLSVRNEVNSPEDQSLLSCLVLEENLIENQIRCTRFNH